MERKFIYEIAGFRPPGESIHSGGYGFSVYLDREFALRARQTKLDDRTREAILTLGKGIIRRVWQNSSLIRCGIEPPYGFVEDSYLLSYCGVPGDRCSLGLGSSQVLSTERGTSSSLIEYGPHNVDNPLQAYGLLSLWLRWLDGTRVALEKTKK